jgi:hypothetical protein
MAAMSTRCKTFCGNTVMRGFAIWTTVCVATAAPMARAVKAVKVEAMTTDATGVSVQEYLLDRLLTRITMTVVGVLVVVAMPLVVIG